MMDSWHASSWLKPGLTLFAIGAFSLSVLNLLAQFIPGVPFLELLVSFVPHTLALGIIAALSLALVRPRAAIAGAVLALASGAPFLLFSKYAAPMQAECGPGGCLTVMTANIYNKRDAMKNLNALAIQEQADIIAINEAVSRMTDSSYRQAFPNYPHVVHASRESFSRHMSSPITLLSRIPIADRDRVLPDNTARRAYIVADLGGDWQKTRIVVTHAMVPMGKSGVQTRDTLLEAAGDAAAQSETFIFMGDFNLTPWSSTFRSLPGKRAGDPRLVATWPVGFTAIGIPIDHMMFAGDLELVEARVLAPIGSDHRPVLAKFRKP